MSSNLNPRNLVFHQETRRLEIDFGEGELFFIPFELMRVSSPSAEVKGHGPGQEVLQTGKRGVSIVDVEPVGHYAIKPTFSDGHDTGLFSWEYLHHLGANQAALWAEYEQRLAAAGASRDSPMPAAPAAGCGTGRH